jgi:excinuclease ABC subunit B
MFNLVTEKTPAGSQPEAIKQLISGLKNEERSQTLLGITGSGKTFTVANVIQELQRPALIMVHNKTLAAQLYAEMKELFPENAVEYFVSYYDYYQPESYIPKRDVYIEKDSSINEQLDMMRHSATINALERRDTIVVSSVSCIYGIGNRENYTSMRMQIKVGDKIPMQELSDNFIKLQYERNDIAFDRGKFQIKGDTVEIFPCHLENTGIRIEFFGSDVEKITTFNAVTRQKYSTLSDVMLYPNKLFATPRNVIMDAIKHIQEDLKTEVDAFLKQGKIVEAQRLRQRTEYDIEMLATTGMCKGIENYSRYIDGRKIGQPPATLFSYMAEDALLFVDESHITTPQIRAMYAGDRSRKTNLVEHGFRMRSAYDNRPLKFEEWNEKRPQTVFVSATPSEFEIEQSNGVVVEQVIRPTGLLDPTLEIHPASNQIEHFLKAAKALIATGGKILALTLTKKFSEKLTDYLLEHGFKTAYLHSEIKTIERVQIINSLRKGEIDIIVGINLLREGIDIPECSLVAILDADKEGFLRNESSLIQMIGRAARNQNGNVLLYADKLTDSIKNAMKTTQDRRTMQIQYNTENGITPTTVQKEIKTMIDAIMGDSKELFDITKLEKMTPKQVRKLLSDLTKQMKQAAKDWDFERAEELRLQIKAINAEMMEDSIN